MQRRVLEPSDESLDTFFIHLASAVPSCYAIEYNDFSTPLESAMNDRALIRSWMYVIHRLVRDYAGKNIDTRCCSIKNGCCSQKKLRLRRKKKKLLSRTKKIAPAAKNGLRLDGMFSKLTKIFSNLTKFSLTRQNISLTWTKMFSSQTENRCHI